MEQFKKNVAANLSALRKQNQYTQLQLAELLHYSDKAVSKWERGESLPDLYILKQIADLYHVSLDELVMSSEEREQRLAEAQSVDAESISAEDLPVEQTPEEHAASQRKRCIIAWLAALLVWLIATICYVSMDIFIPNLKYSPLTFLYALPITAITWLVFNSIWFNRRFNYVIISVLVWSLLATLYITFWKYHIWKVFILGIPAQIIIVLWSRLHPSEKK